MKKVNFYAVFLCFLVVFYGSFSLVQGKDLSPQNTGLLPSNPFYFIKEWARKVQQALTFDSLKKMNYEIDILNEKAEELRKMASITPDRLETISVAIDNYELNINELIPQMDLLKSNSSNVDVNKFLNRLIDLSLRHTELFDQLTNQFKDNNLVNKLRSLKKKIISLVALIPQKVEKFDDFRSRVLRLIETQDYDFGDLRSAEFLDQLESVLPESSLRSAIDSFKKDLLLRFGVQLQQGIELKSINDLNMDPSLLLKILDDIRKSVVDQDLKNQLNILRQQIFDQMVKGGKVSREDVQSILDQAAQAVTLLQTKIKASPLVDQAKFYLSQANNFWGQDNLGGAYSQAILAIGTVDEAIRQLSPSDSQTDIVALKKEFDKLATTARANNLQRNNAPKLFELLDKVEKLIATASDGKSTASNLQDIKIALINANSILKSYLPKEPENILN